MEIDGTMKIKVSVDFDSSKILKKRGLGSSKEVQKYTASEVKRLSDPYTPFLQGDLQRSGKIAPDGSNITYNSPYAHYQFYGKAMGGRAPKHYTGADLTYNGAPMRGARWTVRMLADKRKEIEKNVETFIAKKGG